MCFALCFAGASKLLVEAMLGQGRVLLSHKLSNSSQADARQQAVKILEVGNLLTANICFPGTAGLAAKFNLF